jgi:hypothetical protein
MMILIMFPLPYPRNVFSLCTRRTKLQRKGSGTPLWDPVSELKRRVNLGCSTAPIALQLVGHNNCGMMLPDFYQALFDYAYLIERNEICHN